MDVILRQKLKTNKPSGGSPPRQPISSPALPCWASPHSPLQFTVPPYTSALGMPHPFLPCFKPEGRQHLLLEAFPDCPWPCPGVYIHTALSLDLGLPEHGVKSFPSVSPALGTLQVGALSGFGGTPLPIPLGLRPPQWCCDDHCRLCGGEGAQGELVITRQVI